MDHPVLHMLMLLIFSWEYVCLASWTQKRWHHQRHGRCALGRRWCKFVDASQIIFFKMWKPISQRCSRFCWQTKQHNRMVGGLRFLHIVEQVNFIFLFKQRLLRLYVFQNHADCWLATRGGVELNQTNFKLIFIEFFELFFTFRINRILNFRIELNESRI